MQTHHIPERRKGIRLDRSGYREVAEEAYRLFIEGGRRPESTLECWRKAEFRLRPNCTVK